MADDKPEISGAPGADLGELGFDPNALREKYRAERDRRLRADGNEQYVEIAGQFAHYLEDPYVERIERAPVADGGAAPPGRLTRIPDRGPRVPPWLAWWWSAAASAASWRRRG